MSNVKVGPTTIVGLGTSALAALPLLVKLLESHADHLGTPEQVSSLVALVSFALTLIGRFAQAHALAKK